MIQDHQNMGRRYIEVFKCKKQEYYNAVAAEVQYEQGYDANYHYQERSEPSRSKKVKDKDEMEYTQILKLIYVYSCTYCIDTRLDRLVKIVRLVNIVWLVHFETSKRAI